MTVSPLSSSAFSRLHALGTPDDPPQAKPEHTFRRAEHALGERAIAFPLKLSFSGGVTRKQLQRDVARLERAAHALARDLEKPEVREVLKHGALACLTGAALLKDVYGISQGVGIMVAASETGVGLFAGAALTIGSAAALTKDLLNLYTQLQDTQASFRKLPGEMKSDLASHAREALRAADTLRQDLQLFPLVPSLSP